MQGGQEVKGQWEPEGACVSYSGRGEGERLGEVEPEGGGGGRDSS